MRNILINDLHQKPIDEQSFEIVERKGLGHPDSICDGIMNSISIELSKEYLNRVGAVLHHNADKSLLVAGETEIRFGGGIVKKPMLLVMGDRATFKVDEINIPVEEIAVETAKRWIKENLRFVDPEAHVNYQIEFKPGSPELTRIFLKKGILDANDTSAAVGYAPMSKTEELVLNLERYLNSKGFKNRFPETGEDIKVMGLRRNKELYLTVSMAFIDRFIESEEEYFAKKEEVFYRIKEFLDKSDYFDKIALSLNTLDERGKGISGVYLTVLGTSAESADSGQVGRGNRVNGVIPLNRPICSEAAAGKNPVSHVGKIYNVLTYKIANDVFNEVSGLLEVYIWLLSQIGKPIDEPTIAVAEVIAEENSNMDDIKRKVRDIVEYELANIEEFCESLIRGDLPIY
ncbi:methionine adenosyltransferase [Candidatus Bathyarchaeota archaeon]|nr:methionine adenosyltransferase [Candidatus Bathyarchaeota archaeon]